VMMAGLRCSMAVGLSESKARALVAKVLNYDLKTVTKVVAYFAENDGKYYTTRRDHVPDPEDAALTQTLVDAVKERQEGRQGHHVSAHGVAPKDLHQAMVPFADKLLAGTLEALRGSDVLLADELLAVKEAGI
jgi:hypothetical protein